MDSICDKNFITSVKNVISEHSGEKIDELIWLPLSGVGSTSQRLLLKVMIKKKSHYFVIKRYSILRHAKEESILQANREYNSLLSLRASASELWAAPEPVGLLYKYATVIMGYCPGLNVNEIFWGIVKWSIFSRWNLVQLIKIMKDIALIIIDIQSCKNASLDFPVTNKSSYIESLIELLESLHDCGIESELLHAIEDRVCHDLDSIITQENRCLQHTDLYFNNIINDGEKYYILDFPNACNGNKYWDISHMVVSLEDYKIFRNVDRKVIDACKYEFLRHFSIDTQLLHSMHLYHYCFSLNIRINSDLTGIKKVLTRAAHVFYEDRIKKILSK